MKVPGLKGSLYQRGETWWIKFRQFGRVIRESSGSSDRTKAEKLLLKRNAALEEGRTINERLNKCKVDRLLDLVLTDQETKKRKDRSTVARRIRLHIRPALGWRVAASVTTETLLRYIEKRQGEGAAPATIDHDLTIIGRAFKLGRLARLVDQAPPIEKLPVNNARQVYFKRGDFERVLSHLPTHKGAHLYVAPVLRFAHHTGWRKTETLSLTWKQVDFEAGTIRLAAATTKSGKPRLCPFTPELRAILEAQRVYTDTVNRERGILCPWVFHREGERVRNFYTAWHSACLAAGLAQRLPDGRIRNEYRPHDLRRTAARNFARAGLSEQVAMKFTGHETAIMYRRYNVTDEDDMRAAAERLAEFQRMESAALAEGHNPGTVTPIDSARAAVSR